MGFDISPPTSTRLSPNRTFGRRHHRRRKRAQMVRPGGQPDVGYLSERDFLSHPSSYSLFGKDLAGPRGMAPVGGGLSAGISGDMGHLSNVSSPPGPGARTSRRARRRRGGPYQRPLGGLASRAD